MLDFITTVFMQRIKHSTIHCLTKVETGLKLRA